MKQLEHPRYVFFESQSSAEKFLSNEINNYVRSKPSSILSFEPTTDFLGLYELIAKKAIETQTSYKRVSFFSPSETCPNDVDIIDLASYNFLSQNFVSKTDIDPQNFFCMFDSNFIQIPNTELKEFDDYLKQKGGIDVLVLTVGDDGTLLINLPQTELNSKTRIVSFDSTPVDEQLYQIDEQYLNFNENQVYQDQEQNLINDNGEQQTIDANNQTSDSENQDLQADQNIDQNFQNPSICWATLGLEAIKRSKKIYVLMFGENKSELLSNFFFGSGFDINIPFSCLRENPNTTIIADLDAAKIVLSYAEKSS